MATDITRTHRDATSTVSRQAHIVQEHVAKIVAAWPALTREQLDGITVVLADSRVAATAEATLVPRTTLVHMKAVRATRKMAAAA